MVDHASHRSPFLAALLTLCLLLPQVGHSANPYMRSSLGYEKSNDTNFRDNHRNATTPPALGRTLGAYGDLGESTAFELSLGKTIHSLFRIEAVVARRNGFEFSGNANFAGAGSDQPTTATFNQYTAMAFGYVDLSLLLGLTPGKIEPYLGAGLGVARNELGSVRFSFPDLATQPASSITQSGSDTQFAMAATAGLGLPLTNSITVDIAWRYSDYGQIKTDSGTMEVQRGTNPPSFIAINSISAPLRTHAIYTGFRLIF